MAIPDLSDFLIFLIGDKLVVRHRQTIGIYRFAGPILAHGPTTAEWLWREVLTLQSAFEHPIELDRLLHNRHVLKRAPRSWRTKLEGLSR
jgi:hypothetical protein